MACNVGMSVGRALNPSADTPADTAPELTSTTSWPAARSAASWSHIVSMKAVSMTPSRSVMLDVPILATTRIRLPLGTRN
jgi:hypothetical protein